MTKVSNSVEDSTLTYCEVTQRCKHYYKRKPVQSMYILFITHFFPPTHNAGTENYTLGLAQAFQAKGHTVKVICAEGWQTGSKYWNGVTEETYDSVPVSRIHLNWTKAANPNQVLFESLPVEHWFNQFFKTHKPDIVHVTSTYSLGISTLRSTWDAGIPLVLTLMDFWFLCPRTVLLRGDGQLCNGQTTSWECQECLLHDSNFYLRIRPLVLPQLRPIFWYGITHVPVLARLRGARGMTLDMARRKHEIKASLRLPNIILSHSSFVQSMFKQADLSQRILHLPNGLDLSWAENYKGKNDSSVIRCGYIGQIMAIKGVHILIEAFRNLHLGEQARLDIWGSLTQDSSYTQKLQQLIGDAPSIKLQGRFEHEQLTQVLAEIDVLVVPSLWYENAPLVIQEAFATKTPVIATNLGGMAEAVIHDVNGLLFTQADAGDLARQLQRIVVEPDLLERLRNGIPPVKTVAEEVIELEAIYQNLILQKEYQAILT